VNKTELAGEVKARLGISLRQARGYVDAIFEEVARAVAAGEKVTLTGLGVFERATEGTALQPVFRPARNLTEAMSGLAQVGVSTARQATRPVSRPRPAAAWAEAAKQPTPTTSAPPGKAPSKAAPSSAAPSSGAPRRVAKKAAKKATSTAPSRAAREAPAGRAASRRSAAKAPAPAPLEPREPAPPRDPLADAVSAATAELTRPRPETPPGPSAHDVLVAEPEPEDTVVHTSETPTGTLPAAEHPDR